MRGSWGQTGGNLLTNKWFVLLMASVVFILTTIFLAVRRFRLERERQASEVRFAEHAASCGLSDQERRVLSGITSSAFIKHKESVFTAMAAFNRGAAKLMQERFAASKSLIDRKKLCAVVNSVRAKLGFKNKVGSSGVRNARGRNFSSRQIPVGKKIWLCPSGNSGVSAIEGVVGGNDELELEVRCEVAVVSAPGEMWNVRYQFGSATWEFDVLTMACNDKCLILSHSDNIRFVNRRRFLRVSVRKPALVARFPAINRDFRGGSMAPRFVEGTITELSGPGLRINSDIDVDNRDRVLVVFELEDGKLVEDIGEVRGQREAFEGSSIGVELLGLNDSGVDEMVRVTNNVAIRGAFKESTKQEALAFAGEQLSD